jgi:hypothetical protein
MNGTYVQETTTARSTNIPTTTPSSSLKISLSNFIFKFSVSVYILTVLKDLNF